MTAPRRTALQLATATATALALAACATRGAELSQDHISHIQRGVTTEQEVRDWFGTPISYDVDSGGRERWLYLHEETTRRDTGSITKIAASIASLLGGRIFRPPVDVAYENRVREELEVYFDPRGVVSYYRYAREEIPTRRVY